jgi:WD40 repeat protein
LIHVESGVVRWTSPLQEKVFTLCFSANGANVLGVGERCVVWRADTGDVRLQIGDEACGIDSAALSPDGERLCVSETRYEIKGPVHTAVASSYWLIEVSTGRRLAEVVVGRKRSSGSLAKARFSPNGKTVLVVDPTGPTAYLADAETGKIKNPLGTLSDGSVWGVEFHPDGRILVSTSKGLGIWDASTGDRTELIEEFANLRHFAFSAKGDRVATSGAGALRLHDGARLTELAILTDGVESFAEIPAFIAGDEQILAGRNSRYPASPHELLRLAGSLLDAAC